MRLYFVFDTKQKYRDNGPIEIDGRHEMYGPRPNFHNTEHPSSNNTTNGCNGSATVNGEYDTIRHIFAAEEENKKKHCIYF